MFINFSEWILAWFIFYKLKIIKYNPKIFVLFGVIDNIIGAMLLLKYNTNSNGLIFSIIIKVIMFYSLKNTKYLKSDFNFGLILYIVYIIWLYQIEHLTIIQLKQNNFYNSLKK